MALVFLTLIICALVITGLNRVFRPKLEEEEKETAADALPVAATVEHSIAVPQPAAHSGDEAAAVAIAIALARRAASQVRSAGVSLAPATPWNRAPLSAEDDERIVGEVVTVVSIDPGPAIWSNAGRIQAAR
jgi:Na+-transporting methylmalonyl-CoA/oxaloacetate decarboxylase gamma subunit